LGRQWFLVPHMEEATTIHYVALITLQSIPNVTNS
jgi:hypothetical protein